MSSLHAKLCSASLIPIGMMLVVGGCGTSSPPTGPQACMTETECATGEACIDGICVFQSNPPQDGGMDSGTSEGGTPILDADTDAEVGPPDSGPPDAGQPDAGQPRCMTPDCNQCGDLYPTAMICENFDDAVVAPWSPSLGAGGSLALSTTQFLSGGSALQASTAPGSSTRYQRTLATPIESGDVYVRAYVFVPDTTVVTEFVVLVNLANASGEKVSLDLKGMEQAQLFRTGGTLQLESLPESVPHNRWTCLEFHYRIAEPGVPGLATLLVDGRIASQLGNAPTAAPDGGFSVVGIGVVGSGAGNPTAVEILIDEFVLSTDGPIGCVD